MMIQTKFIGGIKDGVEAEIDDSYYMFKFLVKDSKLGLIRFDYYTFDGTNFVLSGQELLH